jgi:hypothetical protein
MVKHSRLERDWAARVLLSLVTDSKARLTQGALLRSQMLAAIEKGDTPTGYRPLWLRQSAHKLIDALHRISIEFNDTHSTDQASMNDMLDILATAAHLVQKAQAEITPEATSQQEQPKLLA